MGVSLCPYDGVSRETLQCLERESGVTLFQDPVVMLRDKCLAGAWDEVSRCAHSLSLHSSSSWAPHRLFFSLGCGCGVPLCVLSIRMNVDGNVCLCLCASVCVGEFLCAR